jgi:hypothetical protein
MAEVATDVPANTRIKVPINSATLARIMLSAFEVLLPGIIDPPKDLLYYLYLLWEETIAERGGLNENASVGLGQYSPEIEP